VHLIIDFNLQLGKSHCTVKKWGVISLVEIENPLGCCIRFHGNVSVKVGTTQKRFDLCTEVLLPWLFVMANTIYSGDIPLYS